MRRSVGQPRLECGSELAVSKSMCDTGISSYGMDRLAAQIFTAQQCKAQNTGECCQNVMHRRTPGGAVDASLLHSAWLRARSLSLQQPMRHGVAAPAQTAGTLLPIALCPSGRARAFSQTPVALDRTSAGGDR
eukprot:jgi/Ulvmu1/8512/UM044_0046.1